MKAKRRAQYTVRFSGNTPDIVVATTCFKKALEMAADIKPKGKIEAVNKHGYQSSIYIEGE